MCVIVWECTGYYRIWWIEIGSFFFSCSKGTIPPCGGAVARRCSPHSAAPPYGRRLWRVVFGLRSKNRVPHGTKKNRLNSRFSHETWWFSIAIRLCKRLPEGNHLWMVSIGKSPYVIGKSSINGPFSIAMLVYQRVFQMAILGVSQFLGRTKTLWTFRWSHVWFTVRSLIIGYLLLYVLGFTEWILAIDVLFEEYLRNIWELFEEYLRKIWGIINLSQFILVPILWPISGLSLAGSVIHDLTTSSWDCSLQTPWDGCRPMALKTGLIHSALRSFFGICFGHLRNRPIFFRHFPYTFHTLSIHFPSFFLVSASGFAIPEDQDAKIYPWRVWKMGQTRSSISIKVIPRGRLREILKVSTSNFSIPAHLTANPQLDSYFYICFYCFRIECYFFCVFCWVLLGQPLMPRVTQRPYLPMQTFALKIFLHRHVCSSMDIKDGFIWF